MTVDKASSGKPYLKKAFGLGATVMAFCVGWIIMSLLWNTAHATISRLFAKPAAPITVARNGGPPQLLDERGLTGYVRGDAGEQIKFAVGRDTYTIANVPDNLLREMVSRGADPQHIYLNARGQVWVADLRGR